MNHLDGADGTLRPGNGAGDVETCARVLYTALLQPKGPQRRAVGRQSWDVLADGAWQIGKRFEPAIIGWVSAVHVVPVATDGVIVGLQ